MAKACLISDMSTGSFDNSIGEREREKGRKEMLKTPSDFKTSVSLCVCVLFIIMYLLQVVLFSLEKKNKIVLEEVLAQISFF